MSKLREQVAEFHRAMGQPIVATPRAPNAERVRLRLSLIAEEFFELLEACVSHRHGDKIQAVYDALIDVIDTAGTLGGRPIDLVSAADALADLDYVIEGTRLEFGIDGGPIADEVHRSNMGKITANGQVVMRGDGKIMKPETWSPPDIEGELRKQGWEG